MIGWQMPSTIGEWVFAGFIACLVIVLIVLILAAIIYIAHLFSNRPRVQVQAAPAPVAAPAPAPAAAPAANAGEEPWYRNLTSNKNALAIGGALLVVLLLVGIFWSMGSEATIGGGSTPASWASQCPHFPPKPLALGQKWVDINPDNPNAACDFVVEIEDGRIATSGPSGTYLPTKGATGLTKKMVVSKVRALSSQAHITYTLCPWGKGPHDGGWDCKL